MIKDFENTEKLLFTITLKNGEIYENKDITQAPFGQDNFVAFWHDNKVRMVPISLIKYVDMIEEPITE